jgi:hypothetical protein
LWDKKSATVVCNVSRLWLFSEGYCADRVCNG